MNLNDLSARELARIDAICLDYERKLRERKAPAISELVEQLGGKQASVLRAELEAVRAEIAADDQVTRSPRDFADLPATEPMRLLPKPGDAIGPYLLCEVLGQGGMGIVFKAKDTRLDRLVAIKMLAVTGKHRGILAERFQREARAVAGLSHPNIVELFDVGVAGGVPYAVMEYLHGDVLVDRLEGNALSAAEVRQLGAQIADALAAAHVGGVIHRDLKPHNIMLVLRQGGDSTRGSTDVTKSQIAMADDSSGVSTFEESSSALTASDSVASDQTTIVKLVDFGLSRQPRVDSDDDATRIGTIMGTPGYMSPEQARGDVVTAAADIFGLGCVLFEAFYGKRAFDGPTAAARFAAVLESKPIADPIRRQADPALAALIDRCLAKPIAERPASAIEIARELRSTRTTSELRSTRTTGEQLAIVSSAENSTRRRFMESIAGGLVGALSGQLLVKDYSEELGRIRRVAVVSLFGKNNESVPNDLAAALQFPVGDRVMTGGEELAGMLAQELQRLPDLVVRPYRPIVATTSEDFIVLGKELEVDAFVTGLYNLDQRGAKTFITITLEMISAVTGKQLWSETIVAEKAQSLIEQTELIGKLAAAINRRLMPPGSGDGRPKTVEAFGCLSKGHTYLDPDNSAEGLEMAARCFEHSINVDGRYPDAYAGLSLTLITLATRGKDTDAAVIEAKVNRAREAYSDAHEISPGLLDVQLAGAILDWQTYYRRQPARLELESLAKLRPNDWRVHHQLGLLNLSEGDFTAARMHLLVASQLHPKSISIRTDRTRLEWFAGAEEQAIDEATRLLETFPQHVLAKGLLVDIYEQSQQYALAAKLLPGMETASSISQHDYFVARQATLMQVPYGPFNGLLNRSIHIARSEAAGINEARFEMLSDSLSPSLPLLVACHPAFKSTRGYERAKLMLSI